MKRRIAMLTGFVFLAMLGAANVRAQNSARFTIPFAFMANDQSFPAGVYRVQIEAGHPVLRVLNTGKGHSTFLMVRPGRANVTGSGGMVFVSNGTHYYLREVRMRGSDLNRELTVPRLISEELASTQEPGASTIVAAK